MKAGQLVRLFCYKLQPNSYYMQNEKKLFLLDAYALIFRAYYAFISRPIKNTKGQNTSAIFGFINSLDEILRKEKPSHIAVAFDFPAATFRHEMYKEYKANREETPADIKLSVPYIKRILDAYNIKVLEMSGFEADDIIGSIAKRAQNQGFITYMMTPDKDYAQLVDKNIFMYKPRRSGNENEILDTQSICSNYEITNPLQVIDILALWGDASDNIPGAPGIGEKTAKKLIARYGSVEKLLESLDDLKGKQKENLESHIDQILLSKKLVTIDTNVPLEVNLDDLEVKPINYDKLEAIFNELEFNTLKKRIIITESKINIPGREIQQSLFGEDVQISAAKGESSFRSFDATKVSYSLVWDKDEVIELCKKFKGIEYLCLDTETTGLNVYEARILGLALSYKENEAYYIAFPDDRELTIEMLNELSECFMNEKILKIGHNIKYDLQILRNYETIVKGNFFDTMVAHYLLKPEAKHKLDNLAESILNYRMIPITDLIGEKGKHQKNMSDVDLNTVKDYACEDADITLQLYKKLKSDLESSKLSNLSDTIEMPLTEVLTYMELAGFKLDTEALNNYSNVLLGEIKTVESNIYELAGGESFNISSPKQLGVILFEKLKISSDAKMTKTKQYATGEDVLLKLIDRHPIVKKILDYRSLTKLQSTYVSALPKLIEPKTQKIHTSFNQTIVATGRLSSINPNLQNIPIREERGREIRKSFIPSDENHILLSADYSQIELRIMAHLSEDKNMIESFHQGADIHRSTAAKIFKVSDTEVTPEMRSKAKTANFGIIYGISAFGLSQRLHIPRSEAKELIDNYFETFPQVNEYMKKSISSAKEKGYVTTMYGRKRYLPDIYSSNSVVRGFAERNAINSPIQGTAADIIKKAMISIHNILKNGYKTKMILQVHDELVFDVFKSELDEIRDKIKYEMENVEQLRVPLIVEAGIGNNWLEAH